MKFVMPVVSAVAVLALAACGSSTSSTSSSATPATSNSTSPSASMSTMSLTLTDGWCKSTDSMMEGMTAMTGCFGMLKNTGSMPVTVMGGMTPAAKMVETHETVKGADGKMAMQKATAGFTIPAGGSFELKPGGNHIMLMSVTAPLEIGDQVMVTLTGTDGATAPVSFQARTFDGANETYVPVK